MIQEGVYDSMAQEQSRSSNQANVWSEIQDELQINQAYSETGLPPKTIGRSISAMRSAPLPLKSLPSSDRYPGNAESRYPTVPGLRPWNCSALHTCWSSTGER